MDFSKLKIGDRLKIGSYYYGQKEFWVDFITNDLGYYSVLGPMTNYQDGNRLFKHHSACYPSEITYQALAAFSNYRAQQEMIYFVNKNEIIWI